MVTATSAVIVAGLTGRAGPIVFSPLPVSERRRMTNNADANQVVAFQRDPNGTLDNPHSYGTDGRGSGGTVDPLTSQGSLTLQAGSYPQFLAPPQRQRSGIRFSRVQSGRAVFDRNREGDEQP